MSINFIFISTGALLIIAGLLNCTDYLKNQIRSEALNFISWIVLLIAFGMCVYGYNLSK